MSEQSSTLEAFIPLIENKNFPGKLEMIGTIKEGICW